MLTIPVKLDVSAQEAEKALKDFYNGVEGALDRIVDKAGRKITFDINMRKTGDDVVKALDDVDASTKKITKSAKKYDEGQENSIKRTKFRIKELKNEREAMNVLSREYKEAGKELQKHENNLRRLQGVRKNSINSLKAQSNKLKELRNNVAINSPEFASLTKQINGFEKRIKASTRGTNSFVTAFGKLAILSAGIQALGAGLRSVGNAVDLYVRRQKDVEGFNLALSNAGLEQGEVNRVFDQAATTANKLGAPLAQVEKTYKRMIPVLRATGASAQDSDKFIENISARTQTLGLNTEQSGRLLEAFAQVLSKGKLQAEELNQQISELDGAFRVQFAEALGVSVNALGDLISTSQITSEVFVKTVNKMQNGVELLQRRIENGTATIQQLQNQIGNLDTKNLENIGKAIAPALRTFVNIRLAFSEFIKEFTKTKAFESLVTIFNGIAKGAELFAGALSRIVLSVESLLSPLTEIVNGALGLGESFGGAVGVLTAAALAIGAIVVAVKAFIALNKGLGFITAQFANLSAAILGQGAAAAVATPTTITYAKAVQLAGASAGGAGAKIAAFAKSAGGIAVLIGAVFIIGKMVEAFRAADKAAKEMSRQLGSINADFANELEEASLSAKSLDEKVKPLTGNLEETTKEAKRSGNTMLGLGAVLGTVAIGAGVAAATIATGGAALALYGAFAVAGAGSVAVLAKANEDLSKSGRGKRFLENIKEFDELLEKSNDRIQELGGSVGQVDFSNIEEGSGNVAVLSRQYRMNAKALKGKISSLKEVIRKEESKEKADEALIVKSKALIKEYAEQAQKQQMSADAAEALTIELIKQGNVGTGVAASLDQIKTATKQLTDEIDVQRLNAATEAIKTLGKESNAAQLLAATNIGLDAQASTERLNAFNKELEILREKENLKGTLDAKEKARVLELTKLVAKEANTQAQLGLDARNAVIDAFKTGLDEANQRVDILAGAASKLKGSFEGVTGGLQSGLQAATGLINEVVNTEIQGLEVGSQKRKDIIRAQLRAQATANEVENNIAQLRLGVQNKIAQNEARVAQLRLQAEAKLADARGDTDLAKALREAANAQNTVIEGLQDQFEIEKQVLNIQKDTANQKLINKGLNEKLADSAKDVAGQIGVQNINLDAAKRRFNSLVSKSDGLSKKFSEIATKSSEAAKSTQESAINEATNDARELSDALGDAGDSANDIFNAMQNAEQPFNNIQSTSGRIADFLNDARREADGLLQIINSGGVGGPARAMGGPVTAGRQYTVNDGGGREAFLSRSGALSLLPAARNIQWTAPSSGTIIPANMLKAMQRNGDINSSISSKQSIKEPDISMIASGAASGVSGNLAKQLSSAMTGSTSNRIVNNITIQSQNPVHEASDLMTNVARMRIRNRRSL